ncbi:MAG: hypothetical protein CTY15_01690 [Methylocystis sp.]|nr:MAG: hypothetical protein CTY15_01690 [Methylocystis sp.]
MLGDMSSRAEGDVENLRLINSFHFSSNCAHRFPLTWNMRPTNSGRRMNFSGNISGGNRVTGSNKPSASRKGYDGLAGASVLRRTGKAAPADSLGRGDPTATIMAARRRGDAEDRVARQLRDYYQTLTREPVPHSIVALLDSLEAGRKR